MPRKIEGLAKHGATARNASRVERKGIVGAEIEVCRSEQR